MIKDEIRELWRYEVSQVELPTGWAWLARCWQGEDYHYKAGVGDSPEQALANLLRG